MFELVLVARGRRRRRDPVRPRGRGAIAAAIERLLGDRAEAERLVAKGRERVQRFTWERTARLTLASYERARAEHAGAANRGVQTRA
jgi:hypothetical protein